MTASAARPWVLRAAVLAAGLAVFLPLTFVGINAFDEGFIATGATR